MDMDISDQSDKELEVFDDSRSDGGPKTSEEDIFEESNPGESSSADEIEAGKKVESKSSNPGTQTSNGNSQQSAVASTSNGRNKKSVHEEFKPSYYSGPDSMDANAAERIKSTTFRRQRKQVERFAIDAPVVIRKAARKASATATASKKGESKKSSQSEEPRKEKSTGEPKAKITQSKKRKKVELDESSEDEEEEEQVKPKKPMIQKKDEIDESSEEETVKSKPKKPRKKKPGPDKSPKPKETKPKPKKRAKPVKTPPVTDSSPPAGDEESSEIDSAGKKKNGLKNAAKTKKVTAKTQKASPKKGKPKVPAFNVKKKTNAKITSPKKAKKSGKKNPLDTSSQSDNDGEGEASAERLIFEESDQEESANESGEVDESAIRKVVNEFLEETDLTTVTMRQAAEKVADKIPSLNLNEKENYLVVKDIVKECFDRSSSQIGLN